MEDVYIVNPIRTPGCRSKKGAFAYTRPENLMASTLQTLTEQAGIDKSTVDDVMIGCSFPEAEQGLNLGRICSLMAGFPVTVSGATINRFCSSGLEAMALCAMRVHAGISDMTIAGGVESMTHVPMVGNLVRPNPSWTANDPSVFISMGMSAENVAVQFDVSRQSQDEFAMHSHLKAAKAQESGYFTEIVPTPGVKYTKDAEGNPKKETFIQNIDDGIRPNTTMETLAKLKPAFAVADPAKPNSGSVTAGNSSQTTDGAAAALIVNEKALKEFGLKPVAKFKLYTTVGCPPEIMGVGPRYAIPKLLKLAGMDIKDIIENGLFEINEAFASQAVYCARELGIGDPKYWQADSPDLCINISGGAIALGHPLGCTGVKLAATLIANMRRLNKKWGLESMCVGGGLGVAALFELID